MEPWSEPYVISSVPGYLFIYTYIHTYIYVFMVVLFYEVTMNTGLVITALLLPGETQGSIPVSLRSHILAHW